MSALGDRRRRVRHEVVGALWGTLEIQEHANVVNIGDRGALLAAPSTRDVDSIQLLELSLAGHDVQVEARVRHSRQAFGGEHLIGFEFLSVPSALDSSSD
jgi:hypothetical protein